ncbi:MAG: GAF domain-containing sensor histidine kinase [Rhizobacter sp.]|nr:GAF domain-containing sensor histidine kinase [Chlorobiales bacterium]
MNRFRMAFLSTPWLAPLKNFFAKKSAVDSAVTESRPLAAASLSAEAARPSPQSSPQAVQSPVVPPVVLPSTDPLPVPANETERLAALESYNVMDTLAEAEFDALTKLASQICGTPVALMSLIDGDRQWFKSKVGTDATETPRDISFCQHAIMEEKVFEIPNALNDPRFVANPLVTGDMHIRFYAGAPLTNADGYNLGTLCVISPEPQQLSEMQKESLRTLAAEVAARLELRRKQMELTRKNTRLEETLSTLTSTQDQLVQSEKMASLGQMVAGLAHEINTPLGYVRSNVAELGELHTEMKTLIDSFRTMQHLLTTGDYDALAAKVADNEAMLADADAAFYDLAQDRFRESIDGIDRIKDLILNLKDFSRLDEADMKKADLNSGLDSSLKIAGNLLKHRIDVVKYYGDLPLVKCYPAKLNQVFLNLITNAAQASDRTGTEKAGTRGRITIATSLTTTTDGDRVVIEVSDNGHGIAPENLKKIFEPFFTTKPVGKGTGLGLSIAYKIIAQHGGKISVTSTVGEGTAFKIELPIAAEATLQPSTLFADEPTAAAPEPALPKPPFQTDGKKKSADIFAD